MIRTALLLASTALAVLLTSGAAHAEGVIWTELPRRDVGDGLRVTNDTTPMFGWEYGTTSPEFGWQEGVPVVITDEQCHLTSDKGGGIHWKPCESPWLTDDDAYWFSNGCTDDCTWPMPDGRYQLEVFAAARQESPFSEIEHGFRGTQIFRVDTVAPRFVVEAPTGRRVARGVERGRHVRLPRVRVSAKFVNNLQVGFEHPTGGISPDDRGANSAELEE
jgi:hypothetical protein